MIRNHTDIHYELEIAGIHIDCLFFFDETRKYFGSWLKGPIEGKGDTFVSDSFWKTWNAKIGPKDPYNEYNAFSFVVSQILIEHNCSLIHAAAITHKNTAWLITAPSGVGKTTHVGALQKEHPGEIEIISGDRPVLERTKKGFIVHPSPWNGKEGWKGANATPLAGIICLERGKESKAERLNTKEAAAKVFSSVIQSADTEKEIRRTASFVEEILKSVPVWKLTSNRISESSSLLYDDILKSVNK